MLKYVPLVLYPLYDGIPKWYHEKAVIETVHLMHNSKMVHFKYQEINGLFWFENRPSISSYLKWTILGLCITCAVSVTAFSDHFGVRLVLYHAERISNLSNYWGLIIEVQVIVVRIKLFSLERSVFENKCVVQ